MPAALQGSLWDDASTQAAFLSGDYAQGLTRRGLDARRVGGPSAAVAV